MPKIYLDMRAVLTQHSFHCCVDRGDEGVLLERDINLMWTLRERLLGGGYMYTESTHALEHI